jgi:hypothetical protein
VVTGLNEGLHRGGWAKPTPNAGAPSPGPVSGMPMSVILHNYFANILQKISLELKNH